MPTVIVFGAAVRAVGAVSPHKCNSLSIRHIDAGRAIPHAYPMAMHGHVLYAMSIDVRIIDAAVPERAYPPPGYSSAPSSGRCSLSNNGVKHQS